MAAVLGFIDAFALCDVRIMRFIVGSLLASRAPDKVLRPILASTLAIVGGRLIF